MEISRIYGSAFYTTCRHFRRNFHQTRVSFSKLQKPLKSLSENKICFYISRRTLFFRKQINYYQLDKIPENFEIIYQAPMGNYIKWSQITIATVSLMSIVPVAITLYLLVVEKTYIVSDYIESPVEMAIAISALALSIISVMAVVKRYALRIYYNKELKKFIMILPGYIPRQTRQVMFKGGEMTEITEDSLNILGLTGQYVVNKKRVILIERCFQTPYYFNVMLGYDRL